MALYTFQVILLLAWMVVTGIRCSRLEDRLAELEKKL